jgi:hypothetical protein
MMLDRRDEAYKTVDAYRLAFEEQLEKSRAITQQLATMATSTSRAVKAKAAVKFLLSVLADGQFVFCVVSVVMQNVFSSTVNYVSTNVIK